MRQCFLLVAFKGESFFPRTKLQFLHKMVSGDLKEEHNKFFGDADHPMKQRADSSRFSWILLCYDFSEWRAVNFLMIVLILSGRRNELQRTDVFFLKIGRGFWHFFGLGFGSHIFSSRLYASLHARGQVFFILRCFWNIYV